MQSAPAESDLCGGSLFILLCCQCGEGNSACHEKNIQCISLEERARYNKNGRDEDLERMWITTYSYVLYPRPRLYTKVIIIRLFLIYGCDKKLEDPIRRLRMLCPLAWFCINDLQNIEFQSEQPHSYLLLLEEFVT